MTAGHDGDDEAMGANALAGIRSGKSMREIAVELYGADRAAADWHGDSGMRAKVRRLADRAYGMRDGGGSGSIDSTLTGVYPYARLRLGGRLSAWAVAGAGVGDLRLVHGAEVYDTGLDVRPRSENSLSLWERGRVRGICTG